MIQRPQSLFLFLAFLLSGLFAATGILEAVNSGGMAFCGPSAVAHGLNVASFLADIVAAIFSLVAIFLYSNRNKQMKTVRISQILLLLCVLLTVAVLLMAKTEISVAQSSPIVAFLLNQIALKRIAKDEQKVRAADRIR